MLIEKPYNFKIFVLGHDLFEIKNRPFLTKINLNEINSGVYADNQLSECRIYFNDIPLKSDVEYVGFATHQWNQKFAGKLKLENLDKLDLEPDIVWCAKKTRVHWSITARQ